MNLKIYMGFSRSGGSQEGACLVFARNAKEARQFAFPTIGGWFDTDWIDCAVKWMKGKDFLYEEANAEKLKVGEPHVIESPKICTSCELWGTRITETGRCENCEDEYQEDLQETVVAPEKEEQG